MTLFYKRKALYISDLDSKILSHLCDLNFDVAELSYSTCVGTKILIEKALENNTMHERKSDGLVIISNDDSDDLLPLSFSKIRLIQSFIKFMGDANGSIKVIN